MITKFIQKIRKNKKINIIFKFPQPYVSSVSESSTFTGKLTVLRPRATPLNDRIQTWALCSSTTHLNEEYKSQGLCWQRIVSLALSKSASAIIKSHMTSLAILAVFEDGNHGWVSLAVIVADGIHVVKVACFDFGR